jgi:multidrug resistance efflux pump
VRIDLKDYQVAVAKAEADLADAEATLQGSRTEVPITVAAMLLRLWPALSAN